MRIAATPAEPMLPLSDSKSNLLAKRRSAQSGTGTAEDGDHDDAHDDAGAAAVE